MKTKLSNGLLFFFLISMLFACAPKNSETPAAVIDTEQIKKEIQAKEDEYTATYNSGELKNIGYYADDAITYAQNSQAIVGKPAIIEYLKKHIDSISKGNKLACKTNEVFVSNDANQVVEVGYFTITDSASNVVNTGNYMTLFVKRDGKYVSLRDMSTSDLPE